MINSKTLVQISTLLGLVFGGCNGNRVNQTKQIEAVKFEGVVVYEKNGHGLIASPIDLAGIMDWYTAQRICMGMTLDQSNEWRLPTQVELDSLYKHKGKLGGFTGGDYWSSTQTGEQTAWCKNFGNGVQDSSISFEHGYKQHKCFVRAVRTF